MIRFGIIGCGVIAPSHAESILAAEGAALYAVCDILPEKAAEFQKKFGAEKKYTDYHDLLADPLVDAVCICTPSGMHGQMAADAAKAGKHIFCEKPMEITAEKINWMIKEIRKYPVKMGCVFQRRTFPEAMAVKQALESGKFGKILVADAYLKYYRSPEYYKSAGWRATWEWDGGGALMNQGVHGIDLIRWLTGEIDSVYAVTRTQLHSISVEDTAIALVRYQNGAVGVIEGTTCVSPAQDTRFEIHCEKGSIIFSDTGILQWHLNGRPEEKAPELKTGAGSVKDDPAALNKFSHLPLIQDFVQAVEEGREPMIPPEEARKSVDVILAIYQSSRENREIKLGGNKND